MDKVTEKAKQKAETRDAIKEVTASSKLKIKSMATDVKIVADKQAAKHKADAVERAQNKSDKKADKVAKFA